MESTSSAAADKSAKARELSRESGQRILDGLLADRLFVRRLEQAQRDEDTGNLLLIGDLQSQLRLPTK